MAHFAEIKNGIVQRVIVAEQNVIDSGIFGNPKTWIQTSYNTRGGGYLLGVKEKGSEADIKARARKNYAGIGFTYDEKLDVFISPQPDKTFKLNPNTCLWEK